LKKFLDLILSCAVMTPSPKSAIGGDGAILILRRHESFPFAELIDPDRPGRSMFP